MTTYTTAEGLASNEVVAAVEDRRGFLWIGTERGLSRFDGKEFRTFGRERGLSDERVTALVIASDDVFWVGTRSGVYRFDVRNGGVFVQIPVEGWRERWQWERVLLAIDGRGDVWCGADGLYRLERTGDGRQVVRRVSLPPTVTLPFVTAMTVDAGGNLWVGHERLVYRRLGDGRIQHIATITGTRAAVSSLSSDPRGRIWISTTDGLSVIDRCDAGDAPDGCALRRVLNVNVVPWSSPVWKPDGGLWVGTAALLEIDATDRVVRRISREQGLARAESFPVLLDRHGDLWIALSLTGLQRLAADGLTAFGKAEGLEAGLVNSILSTRAGEVVVIGHPHIVQRLDGERFTVTRPLMPAAIRHPGWGWYQVDLQDRSGQWWMSTEDGVIRWPAVRHPEDLGRTRATPLAARGCFHGFAAFRLYEDSHSDVWIGTIQGDRTRPSLHRWRRTTGTIECFHTASFLDKEMSPTAFLDDGRGSLWIGFYLGQVARYRDGRFVCLIDCTNPSQGNITGMLLDRRGRLWIATNRAGVLRLDDISAERPAVTRLTTNEGLASNRTRAVLEDRFGRIYVGTDLGIDVLDADGRRIRHYGVEDGLPHPFINMAQTVENGDLWFGTLNGVARLKPVPPAFVTAVPQILIDGIRVAGVPRVVPASGEREVAEVVLAPDQRNLEVDFVALPRDSARTLRFRYRLSDAEPWSPPSTNRSIVLAGLSAGSHRLQIRSDEAAGRGPSPIATVSFRVLAPVYRRGWFLALAGVALLGVAWALYRARMAAAMALERQRTRIAMDLHDEMGSRLGSIGLLADVAAGETAAGTPQHTRLEHIAETAADMGSSLADIVWALGAGVMTIEGVAAHLAVHGRRLFPGPCPAFETEFPECWPAIEMSPAVGRAMLLIGLEALHNCARHAKATSVRLCVSPHGRRWVLVVTDDGRGLARGTQATPGSGLGLHNMQRRATEIGGTLDVESQPRRGMTVRLTFDPRARERPARRMNIREILGRR